MPRVRLEVANPAVSGSGANVFRCIVALTGEPTNGRKTCGRGPHEKWRIVRTKGTTWQGGLGHPGAKTARQRTRLQSCVRGALLEQQCDQSVPTAKPLALGKVEDSGADDLLLIVRLTSSTVPRGESGGA